MDKYTHCRGVQSSAKLGKIPRRKGRWGNSCGRGLVDLKGPKDGMSDGLFPFLGLAETDIYLLRGFSPQQKYTSSDHSLSWLVLNWLSGWDSGKQKSDTQKLVDGSLGCSWSVATVSILLAPFCHCQMTQRSKLLLDKKPLWHFLDRRWIYPYVLPSSSLVNCTFCLHSPAPVVCVQ